MHLLYVNGINLKKKLRFQKTATSARNKQISRVYTDKGDITQSALDFGYLE